MIYEDMSLVELKQLAKELGIKNISKLKKDELVNLIRENNETDIKEELKARIKQDMMKDYTQGRGEREC